MRSQFLFSYICFSVFYIIEGKPCPEKTRPHKTLCQAFYKCVDLPPRRHVWIPQKCEAGLVYEHKLYMCVLPADDWECMPNSENEIEQQSEMKHVKINKESDLLLRPNKETAEDIIFSVKHMEDSTKPEIVDVQLLSKAEEELSNEGEEMVDDTLPSTLTLNEGSGNGAEQMEVDINEQIENREDKIEQTITQPPSTSKIDPKLAQQLQRLSQIVDGLKQNYENKELRPDQLNAFLTHFNIKNNFNTLSTENNYRPSPISSTTPVPPPTSTPGLQLQLPIPENNGSNENSVLKPENKLLLSNFYPHLFGKPDFRNSQIIISQPEGSFTFRLPGFSGSSSHHHNYDENPNISTETLHRVFELSKQMLATQNVPNLIPNHNYYQQPNTIIQPVIVPFNPNLFSLNANFDYDRRPNGNNNKKYKPKKPNHTVIHNNVHVSAPSGEKDRPLVDSYGLYPPLSNEDLYPNGPNNNNLFTSVTTTRPTLSTEISVTTALPIEFQVTPATIANFYTPSPYLNDQTASNLFQANKHYPTFNYDQRPYQPSYIDRPASLFPTQIDPNKIKIRPNSQKYESYEHDMDEYTYQQPQLYSYNNNKNQPYFISSTTQRPPNMANYEGAHLVRFGGNFIPFETFQKTMLPLLASNNDLLAQVEFIHCATGVRQQNTTDCLRYYVCSKKDQKVLSYTCPPYTGFNANTRICDAYTYTRCTNSQEMTSAFSSSSSLLAQLAAQRRRDQALKTQAFSQMVQFNTQQTQLQDEVDVDNGYSEAQSVFSGPVLSSTTMQTTIMPMKKRKYYCREGEKVADQTSNNSYFVCYKNESGRMKGHKMTCPSSLVFCAETSICTLSERCR